MKTLERKISAAKLALLWERLWPALFPALCVAGVFLLTALTGLLELLPQMPHAVVLAGFGVAFGLALRPAPERAMAKWHGRTQVSRETL